MATASDLYNLVFHKLALLGILIKFRSKLSAALKSILGHSLNIGNLCISVQAGRVIKPALLVISSNTSR